MAGAELIDALKTNLAASSISVSQPHPGAVWITSAGKSALMTKLFYAESNSI